MAIDHEDMGVALADTVVKRLNPDRVHFHHVYYLYKIEMFMVIKYKYENDCCPNLSL